MIERAELPMAAPSAPIDTASAARISIAPVIEE
jgi:hypothetical protein